MPADKSLFAHDKLRSERSLSLSDHQPALLARARNDRSDDRVVVDGHVAQFADGIERATGLGADLVDPVMPLQLSDTELSPTSTDPVTVWVCPLVLTRIPLSLSEARPAGGSAKSRGNRGSRCRIPRSSERTHCRRCRSKMPSSQLSSTRLSAMVISSAPRLLDIPWHALSWTYELRIVTPVASNLTPPDPYTQKIFRLEYVASSKPLWSTSTPLTVSWTAALPVAVDPELSVVVDPAPVILQLVPPTTTPRTRCRKRRRCAVSNRRRSRRSLRRT